MELDIHDHLGPHTEVVGDRLTCGKRVHHFKWATDEDFLNFYRRHLNYSATECENPTVKIYGDCIPFRCATAALDDDKIPPNNESAHSSVEFRKTEDILRTSFGKSVRERRYKVASEGADPLNGNRYSLPESHKHHADRVLENKTEHTISDVGR